jgi:hypothetical protein
MAHVHEPHHVDREVIYDDTGRPFGAGLAVALIALIVLALIAFAVLWSRPWDNGGGGSPVNPNPGISDNNGGGGGTGGGTNNGGGTGGSSGGSSDGGSSGGGSQPAQ